MKEVDLNASSELNTFLKSTFDVTPKHDGAIRRFKYERPVLRPGKSRAGIRLATTDILSAIVQVFESGGETVLHSHAGMDGLWFVLKGHARFYDHSNDSFEVAAMEGLCIPRGVSYWFEKVGDEPLEILQFDAIHPKIRNIATMAREHEKAELDVVAIYDAEEKV
jgi:mannose-6-phosphate isomerase-like protein (cupin superfamily)